MSKRPPPRRRRRPTSVTPWMVAAGVTVLALSVALAVAVSRDAAVTDRGGAGGSAAAVRTGERNAMGMPVIETTGRATGSASAAGVQVAAANWSLGVVPLNTAIRPHWVLRNTGSQPVAIGEPRAEVRQGCCPGPFTIGAGVIPPGGSTTLSFELSMHPGMDGWHDIAVHVPVTSGAAQEHLVLGVTGDFRDA